VISKDQAILRIQPVDVERLFYPVISAKVARGELQAALLGSGINAVPGAAVGRIAFTAADAERMAAADPVILVRKETSPEDVGGMHVSKGILTATGGKTSHAAVVARGWGKCCIVGCEDLRIDASAKRMSINGHTLGEGEFLTLDGTSGNIYKGSMPVDLPTPPKEFATLLGWADERRRMRVRTNADTPEDSKKAIELGAEGIGLCRTEHMFFATRERQLAIQEMIVADSQVQRIAALDRLLPFQREDFIGIFKAMDGRPVTIRLIDPPLHEFVPQTEEQAAALSQATGLSVQHILERSQQLHEANPMLGHRGCRLCITYPEILDMQVRAIIEAAVAVRRSGRQVTPEIMIPLTIDAKELRILTERVRKVADGVLQQAGMLAGAAGNGKQGTGKKGTKGKPGKESANRRAIAAGGGGLHYLVGTMIETPRAAITAGPVAEVAEFFSFGTNDLTQMTMGLSRDDAGRFLPEYVDHGKAAIFSDDPFQTLDQDGVGYLVDFAIRQGRAARAGLKIGICGEHGGDAPSVKFCDRVGMDYVSCSPLRVPIARLAAAQATIDAGSTPGRTSGSKKPAAKRAGKQAKSRR
jgi:pyruvate,orthophosphate dikinase